MNDSTPMTPEQKFQQLFEEMYSLCGEQGWGDPFSYARSREIHLAGLLGHTVADDYSGADAFDENGKPLEYKSTINKNINGTYNGISVQDTWEDQEEYLINDKIGKYDNHFIARYEDGKVVEVWKLSGDDVLGILLPKLKKDWNRKINGNHKDPRLSATISKKEIYAVGTCVLG
tara:strand:+ start:250 stop:771 length:522 start_codon:yes stop_codon:yes gene_type:complete